MEPASRSRAIWLFPIATTAHNLEEAIWLPGWSQHPGRLHRPVAATEFYFAVAVLTIAAWLATWLAARRGGRWRYIAAGYWIAMLLNVIFPHAVVTVLERGYTPGIATALLLNLPVDLYLLCSALRDRWVRARTLALAGALVSVTLLGSIPALFAVGRWLTR
jgi:hypothetical protein